MCINKRLYTDLKILVSQ